MTLVDTSVWIDHLREGDSVLSELLWEEEVLSHPFVVGELACGNLSNRAEILCCLKSLPTANVATETEAMRLIETRALMGKGLGYIDVHLLASTLLTGAVLWSRDKRLTQMAQELGVAYGE